MTANIRGVAHLRGGSNTAPTIVYPAGTVAGDYILIAITWDPSAVSFAAPAGFTSLLTAQLVGTRRFDLLGGWSTGESSVDVPSSANVGARTMTLVVLSGLPAGVPPTLGTYLTRASAPGATDHTTTAPSVTTTTPDSFALAIFAEATTASTNEPAGVTVSAGTVVDHYYPGTEAVSVVRYDMPTPGATPNLVMTYPNVQVNNGGALQLVVPSPVAFDPRGAGLPLRLKTAGGLVPHKLFVKGSMGVRTPAALIKVPRGYPSVDAMLSEPQFYVAHRGGSVSYPEMSLHAYTQSTLKGYKALELSLARTSDGVWFGLHDSTLDRTSGVTGVTASALTWAQVQTYAISVVPAGQTPKPYMRFDELIAAYYRSHVIFVDPKAALSNRAELLTYIKTLPDYKNRIVAKYYGVEGNVAGTSGWAVDARAAGIKSWGYFYNADLANLPTYQGRWDILGMDYAAPAAAWTAINSYGKPVIAHILPNAAAKTTAQAYNPKGFMVSGTALITPS